ncbi:MAG TPA: ABC transporter ATP-binding protein [Bacteroidales bacterium]|nr:ABC transporter ATP-binding protein [Bacteroidales bacterium]HRZ49184.1 ABC transporter ATP-binding protein [Bacteroidales bacterium]
MVNFFEAHNIYKSFAAHKALQDVSISVPEQSVYGLLGPNGAGKTTLIRIINQITAPDSGQVFFNGKPLQKEHIHQIGYLPEERGLYKKMAVGEQALYLTRLKGLSRSEAEKRLKAWFLKFDILSWWNKKVEELSKGMQQKVQFIVTIMHDPKLLIFDEPFSGFDPINTQLLKDEILNLRAKGATIIFSTHNMASVEEICDDIALINRSKKILEGKVDEIRKKFSDNIFEIDLTPERPDATIESRAFTILETERVNGDVKLKVQMNANDHTNHLLQELMPYGQVKGFREMIPGMNDIFIKLVQENNPANLQ